MLRNEEKGGRLNMKSRGWLIKIRGNRTQEQMAKLVGISRSAYSNIESGIRGPSVRMAKKIASALGFEWMIFFDQKCAETKQKRKITA
jgi:putative transcriptional regulator